MPVVQNNIHYIWVGSPLPEAPQAQQAVKWIMENPHYTFYMWGEGRFVEQNIITLKTLLEGEHNAIFIEHIALMEPLEGPQLIITLRGGRRQIVYSRSITLLPSLGNTSLFMLEELEEWKNYGAASDILRIWALYEHGGIYMDFDIYSNGQPLPLNIEAPDGILMGCASPLEGIGLVNSVLAAPAESKLLKGFCEAIEERYSDEYMPTEGTDAKAFNYAGNSRLSALQQIRREIEEAPDPERKTELKKALKELISVHTIMRTGPQMLVEWAHHQWELENYPDPDWMAIMPEDFTRYDFATVTGYPIRIEFENSWIK